MADGAKVVITADDSQVHAAMARTQAAISEGMNGIRSSFDGLTAVFGKVNAVMAATAAILAGGAVFKDSVEAVKDMTLEAKSLANALGVTQAEAHVLNTALGNVFLDKDTYLDATRQITKQINSNGDAFKQLGIATHDAQGKLLPMQQIIANSTARLMEFQAGADRNVMANQLLGKSWEDVLKLAKLTPQVMADAAQEVEDYQTALDPAMVDRYRAAVENSGDVFEGIKTAIGKHAMPALSEFGEWLSGKGPGLVNGFNVVLDKLNVAFESVGQSIKNIVGTISSSVPEAADTFSVVGAVAETVSVIVAEACYFIDMSLAGVMAALRDVAAVFITVWESIKLVVGTAKESIGLHVDGISIMLKTLGNIASAVLSGDFKGAGQAWDNGLKELQDKVSVRAANMARLAKEGGAQIAETWKYSGIATFSKDAAEIEEAYNARIAKIFEKAQPKQKPAPAVGGSGGNETAFDLSKGKKEAEPKSRMSDYTTELSTLKQRYQVENDLQQMSIQQEMVFWEQKKQLAAGNEKDLAAIALKMQELRVSQMQKEHNQKSQLSELEIQAQQKSAEYALESERMFAQQSLDLGAINKSQMLEQERGFEERRYQIQLQAINERLALLANDPTQDPIKYQQMLLQKEEIERQHQQKMAQIQNKMKLEDKAPQKALFANISNSMTSLWDKGLNAMLNRTLTWKGALNAIWMETARLFAQHMVMQPLQQWLAAKAKELAVHLGFLGTKQAADTTAAGATVEIKTGEATAVVGANAAEAASGAAASVASIPYVGWAMAAGVFAATMAMVMGAGSSIKSASGGYSIPRGVNPITQLHEEEMVLPKTESNFIRDLAANGASGGVAPESSGGTVNYHDYSGKLTRDQIRGNAKMIAEELSRVTKRGWQPS